MGKRWTWVAWSMLALFAISVAALCVLAVATGNIHHAPTDNVALRWRSPHSWSWAP